SGVAESFKPDIAELFVVVQEAEDVVLLKLFAALEEVEFDGEAQACDLAAELADQLDGGLHRAAGGEQVIDDDDALAGLNGVEMDLERVAAVLEVVGHACGL